MAVLEAREELLEQDLTRYSGQENQTRGNEVINSSGLNKLDAEQNNSKGMLGVHTTHLLVALDLCNIHLDQDKPEIPTRMDLVDIFKVRVSSRIILKQMLERSMQTQMMIDLIDILEIRCLNGRL